jgi:hypothetical protein
MKSWQFRETMINANPDSTTPTFDGSCMCVQFVWCVGNLKVETEPKPENDSSAALWALMIIIKSPPPVSWSGEKLRGGIPLVYVDYYSFAVLFSTAIFKISKYRDGDKCPKQDKKKKAAKLGSWGLDLLPTSPK